MTMSKNHNPKAHPIMLIPFLVYPFSNAETMLNNKTNLFFLWDLCKKMHLNVCWTEEKDDGSYQLWQSYDSVKTWQRKHVRKTPLCHLSLQPWNFFSAVLCSCRLLSLAVMLRWVNVILNMTLAILNWWYLAIWTMRRFQPIIRDIGNTTPITTWMTGYT